ncbi:MAG TPA: hypothetical protein VHE79_03205 [Spirochaetia bacterium]
MRRLVGLVLGDDGEIRDDVARRLLAELSRSELKRFNAALQRELARRRVSVVTAGEAPESVRRVVGERYPGREIDLARDEFLGAGLRVRAGDDIVDASIRGYIRGIIEKLEGT